MDRRLKIVLIALAMVAFAALALFDWRSAQRAEKAETNLPYETAKILEATLAKSASLRVATLKGRLVVTAADPGFAGLFPSNQKAVMPYAVDYFVNLGRLTSASYRWDAAHNTMLIALPDVAIAPPNVDEARAQGETASGVFVSRGASDRLHQQMSARAGPVAAAQAVKPENLAKARNNARDAVSRLTRAPLTTAGLGNVNVAVRFPFENRGALGDRWDESTPLDVVLGKPR